MKFTKFMNLPVVKDGTARRHASWTPTRGYHQSAFWSRPRRSRRLQHTSDSCLIVSCGCISLIPYRSFLAYYSEILGAAKSATVRHIYGIVYTSIRRMLSVWWRIRRCRLSRALPFEVPASDLSPIQTKRSTFPRLVNWYHNWYFLESFWNSPSSINEYAIEILEKFYSLKKNGFSRPILKCRKTAFFSALNE